MDRFIDSNFTLLKKYKANLKSNMDRFIVKLLRLNVNKTKNLKSNMDRFIARSICVLPLLYLI